MTSQIFISSYPGDYRFLIHCLASIGKFSRNFLPTIVCVDANDVTSAQSIIQQSNHNCRTAIYPQKPGMSGFMRAQLGMMHADIMCPDADIIYFLGSDCLVCDTLNSQQYLLDGKPVVLYRPYAKIQPLIWGRGTERVLGFPVENEYMGRLPSVYPRGVFSAMRAHVQNLHNKPFDRYIYEADAIHRNTSEANILGAYAHKFMPDSCVWVNALEDTPPERGWAYPVGQHWSHGGLDRPMEACYTYTVNGVTKNSVGRTPRKCINEIVYGIFT